MDKKKKIRILHIAQSAGGVDRYIKMLLKYMNRDEFENIVVLSQDFKKNEYEMIADVYETVEMQRSIGLKDLKSIGNIRKIIRKYKPDILYVHSSKAGAIGRIANLGFHNKIIYNPHGWAFNMGISGQKKLLYKYIEKIQIPFTDKIICISESEKVTATSEKICKIQKLSLINNGIDLDEIENSLKIERNCLGISKEAFVVGMVGRISKQKAPDIFVKAASLIKKSIPNAVFLIVGDEITNGDNEKQKIINMIENEGLTDSFIITGWVKNPVGYMKIFDVAVLLSRWEGFGLVLAEYMASGVPIVATAVDAIPFIIENNKNGILVNVDNEREVAEAVKIIKDDEILKKKLIKEGKECVEKNYNVKRVAYETEKLIKELIG